MFLKLVLDRFIRLRRSAALPCPLQRSFTKPFFMFFFDLVIRGKPRLYTGSNKACETVFVELRLITNHSKETIAQKKRTSGKNRLSSKRCIKVLLSWQGYLTSKVLAHVCLPATQMIKRLSLKLSYPLTAEIQSFTHFG